MTQWPEPAPEPGEAGRRLKVGAVAGVVALSVWAVLNSDGADGFSWRLPEITLPEFSLPDVSMPDIDLRGRASDAPSTQQGATTDALPFSADGGPVVQNVPFETCAAMLAEFPNVGGQEPIVVEDAEDRVVRRYKLQNGNMTATCARAENTLTIEPPG